MSEEEAIKIVKEFNKENRFRDCGKLNNAMDIVIRMAEERNKNMKIIDLLNKIARGDEMPKLIKVKGVNYIWTYDSVIKSYKNSDFQELLYYLNANLTLYAILNKEVELL